MSFSNLKIGLVLDDSLDRGDGVQQYVLTLGAWLSAIGHEVHYLVGETQRSDLPHLHSLSRNVTVRFNGNRLSIPLPANRQRLGELLARENYDILHVQLPHSPFLAGRLMKAAGPATTIVGTFHVMPLSRLQRLAARGLWLLTRRSLKTLDRVASVSKPASEFAKKVFRLESEVIPNAVDAELFRRGRKLDKFKDDKFNVVFLGRLVERKGVAQLLEAIAKTTEPKLRLIICGEGHLRSFLEQAVHSLDIADKVIFEGYVPEMSKPNYLASADLAVFPSLGGESFGIVLIEAMAANAGVVLGGNNVGYQSVLGQTPGALFDPTDIEVFAGLINKLTTTPSLRTKLHTQQQRLVRQFDIAVVGPQIVELYQAALDETSKLA